MRKIELRIVGTIFVLFSVALAGSAIAAYSDAPNRDGKELASILGVIAIATLVVGISILTSGFRGPKPASPTNTTPPDIQVPNKIKPSARYAQVGGQFVGIGGGIVAFLYAISSANPNGGHLLSLNQDLIIGGSLFSGSLLGAGIGYVIGKLVERNDMSTPNVCPKCQSAKHRDVASHIRMFIAHQQADSPECKSLPTRLKELGPMKGSSSGRQICLDCSHIWEKPTPPFMYYLGLVVGIGLPIPLVCVIAAKNNDPVAIGGTAVLAALGVPCIYKTIQAIKAARRDS